jgi:hypothetical protein
LQAFEVTVLLLVGGEYRDAARFINAAFHPAKRPVAAPGTLFGHASYLRVRRLDSVAFEVDGVSLV